ncbi:metallophosphoesterase family protein [Derxia gummosa]|uniref:Metallophosphoesterase family protein n=1 Tax=Derxia gummosa DSM 723 TaxID=1121388 RepID=A0A8B6XA45_9BURK|nr:metallophosphoesterase [Derxia gummosa]
MSRVLLISDPHFGTERPAVAAALTALAQATRPDLLVLAGDITQRARHGQFAAARAFIDGLGIAARVLLPGNHDLPLLDLWTRWRAPYSRYAAAFGADLEPVHDDARLLVIGVNTTRAARHKDGEVSAAQIERVAARLAAARPGQLRLVVTHQPLLAIRASDEANLLHGHRAAARAWARAGADLLLGGHIHLPYLRPHEEAHQTAGRRMWVVQAGTAVSRRVREGVPNSVWLLRWGGADAPAGLCIAERHDHDDAAGGFRRVERHVLAIDSAPVEAHASALALTRD